MLHLFYRDASCHYRNKKLLETHIPFQEGMKKTIIYIIDSLGRGGAEVMLVSTLQDVRQHYHTIIVTLDPDNAFTNNELEGIEIICLHATGKRKVLSAAKKLKEIIQEKKPSLVHSNLYWGVIVARLACGDKTPHVISLATLMTTGIYQHKWYSGYTKILDLLTYKKYQAIISPTREVLDDFDTAIGVKGKNEVLYNFVMDEFFDHAIEYTVRDHGLKLVAVGNLKDVKNYQLLVDACKLLAHYNISIDIYGEGPDRDFLQQQINDFGLAIHLKGLNEKIYEVLPHYDGFVMCSLVEGFGISAAEAMAIGLPLLLSGIAPLREISKGNALFFDPHDPRSFASVVSKIIEHKIDLQNLSATGKKIARENYTKEKYLKGLLQFYDEVLQQQTQLNDGEKQPFNPLRKIQKSIN
jgi:glycosyltransferase involved in cell wall biosynthesis